MFRFISILVITICFISCSGDDTRSAILSQPPFDKLTDSINRFPDTARLYYTRGQLLYRANEKTLAETDIRTAWQLQPTQAIALSLNTLYKEKNRDSAIRFLEGAIKILPHSVSVPIELIKLYQDNKQFDKALGLCNLVITRYPNQLDALTIKAEMLKDLGRDAEALATLEQGYAFAPDDGELVQMLAFGYAESKNPKALSLADSLIRVDQAGHAEPYYIKGVYYSNTGQPAEAVRQFDEAIRHNFNFIDAYINKGIVYYDGKQYDKALHTFNLAATVSPDEAEPYYWLARTLEAVGNKADARLNYQRAYGLDKTMTEAKERAEKL